VSSEDLAQVLTNKTSYVRKEVYTVFMSPEQSAIQRDQFMRDMYAMLFAFVVETANHRIAPGPEDPLPWSQIVLLDQAGFQSKGPASAGSMMFSDKMPLVHAYGHNGFDEFCVNFADEIMHSYFVRATFEDTVGFNGQIVGDGVALPAITTMDNSGAVELLRGAQLSERAHKKSGGMLEIFRKACTAYKSGKAGDKKDEDLLQDLVSRFGVHASFVASANVNSAEGRTSFGINHYAGPCTYDTTNFVEKDADLIDPAFVTLLRSSSDPFVAKLFSGPSLAAERHSKDENTIVQAQVSSRPLRGPTPIPYPDGSLPEEHPRLDPTKIYPVTTQLNYTLSEMISCLDRTRQWTVSCIRPNDSGSANSFDRRRVKAQIRSLLLPDVIARRSTDFVIDYDQAAFCDRYVPTMGGSEEERVRQCAHANGWREGADYALGHRMIFLKYSAWKMVEDGIRASEKPAKGGNLDDESQYNDDASEYTHGDQPPQNPFEHSADNLLRAGGQQYMEPAGYAQGGLLSAGAQHQSPFRSDADSGWGSDYDKKEVEHDGMPSPNAVSKEGLVVKAAPTAIEEVPTSRTRRYWLYIVWMTTWWIPTFCLARLGRMKRPDVRLAWREKVTIFWLIFFMNAVVVFYIVALSRLLCPNFDKAWNLSELGQHTGTNDFFVAVQGKVYDVSNFVQGQHSDISGESSNTADVLGELAGSDLTYYFPVPLILGCPNLVSDASLSLSFQNFTPLTATAVHTSGSQQSSTGSKLHNSDWYTGRFLPTMQDFKIGDLVYNTKTLWNGANNDDDKRSWAIVNNDLYDLTDYLYSISQNTNNAAYAFLDETLTDLFQQRSGQDITKVFEQNLAKLDSTAALVNMQCLNNVFYRGRSDFRDAARCQVAPIIILVFSIILSSSILIKCMLIFLRRWSIY
jgi:chitin synthase